VLPVLEDYVIVLALEISIGKQTMWPPRHIHREQLAAAAM